MTHRPANVIDSRVDVGFDASPPETDLSALALRLIAQAHDRESLLCRVLAHWRSRMEKLQRLRHRQDLVAQGFYDHRLQFTAYRAWRWAFTENCRSRSASRVSTEHNKGRPLRRAWRAWRRWVSVVRGRRQTVELWELMSHRRLLLGECGSLDAAVASAAAGGRRRRSSNILLCKQTDNGGRSSQDDSDPTASNSSSPSRPAARHKDGYFTAWASRARARVSGRTLLAQWERRMRLAVLRQWSRWTWCIRLPRKIALTALVGHISRTRLLTFWHAWIAQSRRQRLARWSGALDAVKQTTQCKAWSRAGELWRRWERGVRLHRIATTAAVALQRRAFRVWLRLVLWRLKARHDVSRAALLYSTHLQRTAVRRVVRVARVLLDRRLADHFCETSIPNRRLKECWRRWRLLSGRSALLRDGERRAADLRASLLALVAVRRMSDAAERDKPLHDHVRSLVLRSAASSLSPAAATLPDRGSLTAEKGSPVGSRFLSNDGENDDKVVKSGHDNVLNRPETNLADGVPTMLRQRPRLPIPWSAALAAASTAAAPFGTVSTASRSPSIASQPVGPNVTFTRDKETHLRELLSRYRVMMSTAEDDERLWAELSREGRGESDASAQRAQLRQRAETRQLVRLQIAMLQRELHDALQSGYHDR